MINFGDNEFRKKMYDKMDKFVHLVYLSSRGFPKSEIYGTTSQLRRASMSVVLNYVEGYSRFRDKTMLLFFETSWGSIKESEYLIKFAKEAGYLLENNYIELNRMIEEICAMLWHELTYFRKKIKSSHK